jgi:ketosteroid isomerase-like protein
MPSRSPLEVVRAFVEAMNRGDVDAAVSHYAIDGILVVEPGVVVTGAPAIRDALAAMLGMRPRLTTGVDEVLVSNELALYHSDWQMRGTGPDGSAVELGGRSSDVLRRRPSGEWEIAIDNPWGTAVLGPDS